jgi:hypothetical protein
MIIAGGRYRSGTRYAREVTSKHEPLLEQLGWKLKDGVWQTDDQKVVDETLSKGIYCSRTHLFFFSREYVQKALPNRWKVGLNEILGP